MFENPGEKLKKFSKTFFAIGVIAAIVLACVFGIQEEVYGSYYTRTETVFKPIPFFCILIGGILASYTEGLILYGFGELIENTKKSTTKSSSPTNTDTTSPSSSPLVSSPAKVKDSFICNRCGNALYFGQPTCKACGKVFDWSKID